MDTLPDTDNLPEEPVPDKRPADTIPDQRVQATIPDKPSEEPVPDKPRRRRRGWLIALVILVLLCVGVGVGHRPFIEWWIRREALARGFELTFAGLSIVPDRIVLQRAQVRLVGVPQVGFECDELIVDLQGLDPLRIQGKGSLIHVNGSPDELQRVFLSFTKLHAESVRLPMMLDGEYRYGDRTHPWVTLSGHAKSAGDGDVQFNGTWRVQQTSLGTITLHHSPDHKVKLGLGLLLSDKPAVHVALDGTAAPYKAVVTVASQKVDDVCRVYGLSVPKGLGGSSVEGTLSLVLDGDLPAKPHHGMAAFVVQGWVPPHPRELDGIVFGTNTKLGTTFEVLPDLSEVRFTKATVEAGALKLEGKGNTVRDGLSARTKMDLSGNVACSEIGASAIGSHVQGLVGDILRGVTRMTVGGTVKIRVLLDADTKSLSAAKLEQAVEIGCRLF